MDIYYFYGYYRVFIVSITIADLSIAIGITPSNVILAKDIFRCRCNLFLLATSGSATTNTAGHETGKNDTYFWRYLGKEPSTRNAQIHRISP